MLSENLIKAQIIELKVQEELLRYGFDVSVPTYNASKYDLIVDTGCGLLRIQVKKSISESVSGNSFVFCCTNQNVNTKSGAKHKYTQDEIDYFATVWNNLVYLVHISEVCGMSKKTLKVTDTVHLAKNVFCDYKRLSDEELYNISNKNWDFCERCGKKITVGANMCNVCSGASRGNSLPSKDELKNLIRTMSFVMIGKKFGVSDNSVRKWCVKYCLPTKKRVINSYTDAEWEML